MAKILIVGGGYDGEDFLALPQRGIGLQPRVAASATLGKEAMLSSTATRLRLLCAFLPERPRNRVAVENSFLTGSQGSRSGDPGLKAVVPLGHH